MKNSQLNAFRKETIFPINLDEKSAVSIDLFENDGRKIFSVIKHQYLSTGEQKVKISGNQLHSGKYTAKIKIENSKGEFIEIMEVIVN
ncbi:hypothetical protein ODZ84_22915 [Chryseobacterium fluminis]|uniref:hypothetical protein n=1 Tax=Chryseobacterium fluminis TaxID=2983606 RepID=UPI0022542584|nr:hypothetical protein [Chryseobacterium sp. MMS21-Ot14]UZT97979.1 hypothetical protein ODZ84_22915 [Chryseobacterium sp. MMS21-Ot14]